MSGKKATTDIIPGRIALSVGKPSLKIPPGWTWILLSDVAKLATGHTPSRKKPEYWGGEIPWMSVGDARKRNGKKIFETKEYTNIQGIDNSAAVLLPENTVCLSRTASIGYAILLGRPMATSQGFVNWICRKYLNPRFLQLLFLSENRFLYEISEGTAHTTIYYPEVKAFNIAMPNRLVQDRIVAKVDALMTQVESMQRSLERIPQLLKDFRQQVLTQAVTGKLTGEWRGKKTKKILSPIIIDEITEETNEDWRWVNLNEIAKLESGHTPRKSVNEYWENGDVPWICLQDIRAAHGKVINDTKFKPTALGIANSSARLLPKGTVCFSRDISVGFTTIMGKEMATTQHFANWICGDELNNRYLLYAFMQSSNYLIHKGKGTTVKTLYYKDLAKMMFYTPPIKEQLQIVSIVKSLFGKADAIEDKYKTLKIKIDTLPQSILHKAFKGELVEQLPTDGDAWDLLREIEGLKNITK